MSNTVYAMISTRSSNFYTEIAVDSFFKSTKLDHNDIFYIIDNDNEGIYDNKNSNVITNSSPKSFAKNVNDIIGIADGRDVVILSNDVVFTPGWSSPLSQYSNILLLPCCNQTHIYSSPDGILNLQASMHINEYNNQFNLLAEIAQIHKRSVKPGFFERLLMGFYVFKLPAKVYKTVGLFDEQFGVGGGEDVDYRIRAIEKDIPVKYQSQSYLLHFAGKSTWDSSENQKVTLERNQLYFNKFSEKWGSDLANLMLVGGEPVPVIKKHNLEHLIQSQEFSKIIKVVLTS